MTSSSTVLRTLLIYSICLPLAIFVGYILASPDPLMDYSVYFGVGLILFLLILPLLLRWHRLLLLAMWNCNAVLFFLPGRPELALATTWLSFIICILQYVVNPRSRLLSVRSVTAPLLFFGLVVIFTAKMNGGIGFGALGDANMGGKKYLLMITAIVGYFALTSQPIPPQKASLCVLLFFLGYLTAAIGELGSFVPSGAYFLFYLFPMSEQSVTSIINTVGPEQAIQRFSGLAVAATGVFFALLARYSIRELFDLRRLLRLGFFLLVSAVALLGGFRSNIVEFSLTFAILFWLEGLMRSRLLPVMVLLVVLGGTLLVGFVDRLPLNVQRSVTVIPGLNVDPLARQSARSSSEWRLQMWRDVLPQVPEYLLIGRGFGLSRSELQQHIAGRPGQIESISGEGAAIAGDFHNGPLSLLIPLGIWGAIGFIWFIIAGLKVLHRNYRFGHPDLAKLNRLLFAVFIMRTIFFFLVFGAVNSELAFFTGLVGLSIAINGGVARPAFAPQPAPAPQPIRIRAPFHKPAPAV